MEREELIKEVWVKFAELESIEIETYKQPEDMTDEELKFALRVITDTITLGRMVSK